MIITSSYFDDQVLAALTQHLSSGGFNGPLYNCQLMLFDNPITLTNATVFGNLVECVYSGYARKTGVVFSAPILQIDGTYSIISNLYTFIASAMSNFTNDQAYGWALLDNSSPPNLLMVEKFAAPQTFVAPNDGFGLVISYNVGATTPTSFGTVIA